MCIIYAYIYTHRDGDIFVYSDLLELFLGMYKQLKCDVQSEIRKSGGKIKVGGGGEYLIMIMVGLITN